MDTSPSPERCPRCGAALPADAPLGVCPACLLAVAAEPASQLSEAAAGDLTTAISSGAYSSEPARFAPGDTCGPYRIVGLLGRGGMGEVYEAVGADGRRVALKLLRQRLTSENDRERFLREGVLAASVTHRNCVYVYGSEEIGGLPVIAMELAPQGTLKQAVEQFGPRTPAQAVRDILQVVAGLEAAAAAGILHRDVKPSNCFIDADGGIKVGDFGLSLSLNPSEGDIAWKPTFQGTPEFASPEQLRGEPLDLRADIYSVGATLFFLLTGYSPFGERNIEKLIELKTKTPAPSTSALLPDIPPGLTALVGRCMSPDPNRRPQTYEDLREQLLPFISSAPGPASVRRRFFALFLDGWVGRLATPLLLALRTPMGWEADRVVIAVLSLAYFVVCEHWFGGTPGKLILGIRVIDVSGQRPSLAQAAARWALVLGPQALIPALNAAGLLRVGIVNNATVLAIPVFALGNMIYAGVRRDRAMLHDVWTRTRVVHWQPVATEISAPFREPAARSSIETVPADAERVGPFDVVGRIGETASGDLLLGRDPRLRRFVWIHRHPNFPGALPASRRQLAQPTRLRWLAGDDTWDAFEAPEGRAFQNGPDAPITWRELRPWLIDLSRDLEAAEAAGALPLLALERLWVLNSGRAMMLDFRAPGAPVEVDPPVYSVPTFLARLAAEAHRARVAPHSIALLTAALYEPWMTTRTAAALLQELSHEPVEINRWQRAVPVIVCALAPVVFAAGSWLQRLSMDAPSFFQRTSDLSMWLGMLMILVLVPIGLMSVLVSFVASPFLFRATKQALFDEEGIEAGVGRRLTRAAATWSPLFLTWVHPWAALGVLAAGAIFAIASPERSIQDRIAGTFVAPR